MILKEYQKRALGVVRNYLELLTEWRAKVARADELGLDMDVDWAAEAWKKTAPASAYLPRRNGLGEPLPSFCLKLPTGGGKTLLATKVVDLVNTIYRKRRKGLVLWIVPTTQIYNQTLKALKDRDHPYRQQLDLVSAGRTLTLEKTSGFGPRDIEDNLCVLLLMLPSANRVTKAQLRMFRDSGGFDRFFPADDDAEGHKTLLEHIPNLDTFEQEGGLWGRQAKTSLGNTLRLLRPLIILDEGHKAYSRNAKATLEGFNPCMIVELSATPPKGANVLVDIRGHELNEEEMIKLDLHIRNSPSTSWKNTLLESIEHRKRLEEHAREYEARTGVYIRPICLIQVERTGRDQRRPGVVHADDARDYLLQHAEIGEELIAVKTSLKDELMEVDEVGGLLSRDCPIRFIITKQALQEGWDCSFAYVLTILTNPASKSALTQLVGRILRQPLRQEGPRYPGWTRATFSAFNAEAPICSRRSARDSEWRGLQGLEGKIVPDTEEPATPSQSMTLKQRDRYRKATGDLVLPAFMIKDRHEWRLVHYEADILSRVPWDEVDLSDLFDLQLGKVDPAEYELRTGLDSGPALVAPVVPDSPTHDLESAEIDYFFAASHLLDVMPNPWRGTDAARHLFDALLKKHPRQRVAANYVFILEELRKKLDAERDRLSRKVFEQLLDSGIMRFLVVTNDLKFNRLPQAISTVNAKQANREDGGQYQLNLFDRTNEDELNGLENKVATYLDQQERLFFWYRNRARKDYYVQGWKRGRIYADFIFTLSPDEPDTSDAFHRVFVVETKGLHLKKI